MSVRIRGFFAAAVVLALVAVACTSSSSDSEDAAPTTTSVPTPSASTTVPPTGATTTTEAADPAPIEVPPVDLSKHGVPLEEVYFDTFDGGSVPLSEASPQLIERLRDAIPPIDSPVYGPVYEGDWLNETDLVLGYVGGGQAYAYPIKILNFREIINDEIDGVPVLVSYCPLCRSGIVYDRRLGDQVLSFGNTSALYESDLVMLDRQTGSYWWQVPGTAIVGQLTGEQLQTLPSTMSTWADWKIAHPDTLILTRDTGYGINYERDPFIGYEESLNRGSFAFPVSAEPDDRLAPADLVVGVAIDGRHRVYPLAAFGDAAINDELEGTAIVIFSLADGPAGSIYSPVVDGQVLTFTRSEDQYVDEQTGSLWGFDGVANAGELAGTALEPVPGRTTFWFAYVGAFPDAQVAVPEAGS